MNYTERLTLLCEGIYTARLNLEDAYDSDHVEPKLASRLRKQTDTYLTKASNMLVDALGQVQSIEGMTTEEIANAYAEIRSEIAQANSLIKILFGE